MSDKPTNARGFRLYLEGLEQLYGETSVSESSIAFEGAHCWVFQSRPNEEGTQGVHLDVAGARQVAGALLAFIEEATAGELVEPAEPEPEEDEDDDRELAPLDIVDDRSAEQKKQDGDA